MPKRARSDDEENFSCLVKTHVSQREVNLGVLRERNMAKVHERTLSLLFRGPKKSGAPQDPPPAFLPCSPRDIATYRQLSLTPGSPLLPPATFSCFSCVSPSCRPLASCTSCQRPLGSCAPVCDSCSVPCCPLCESVQACRSCGASHCSSCRANLCGGH